MSKRSMRTVFLIVLRKLHRAGCHRLPPTMVARMASRNGPTWKAAVQLDAAVEQTMVGATTPAMDQKSDKRILYSGLKQPQD